MSLKSFKNKVSNSSLSQGGGLAGFATQIFSGGGNYAYGQFSGTNQANENAERNYRLEQENLAYQKWLQQKLFDREDSAIQRRVADYTASGMSPILSAGGPGAGAGDVVATKAPQKSYYGNNMVEAAAKILSLMTMKADVSSTFADTAFKKANADNLAKDIEIKDWDLQLAKEAGVPYNNPSQVGRIYKDAASVLKRKINDLKRPAQDSFNEMWNKMTQEQKRLYKEYYEKLDQKRGKK